MVILHLCEADSKCSEDEARCQSMIKVYKALSSTLIVGAPGRFLALGF
jgi:hypothetical protein